MIVNARTMRELVWSVVRPQEVVVDRSPTGLVTARVVGSGVWFSAREGERISLDDAVEWVVERVKYWRPVQ